VPTVNLALGESEAVADSGSLEDHGAISNSSLIIFLVSSQLFRRLRFDRRNLFSVWSWVEIAVQRIT